VGSAYAPPKTRDREQLKEKLKGSLGRVGSDGEPINYIPWWYAPAITAREFPNIPIWKAFGCERQPPEGSEWERAMFNCCFDLVWAETEAGVHSSLAPERMARKLAEILRQMLSR
jgi:hypothetical protein